MTETDIKRDKYLRKKYGVTLNWYNSKLAEQGGGCAICGSLPVTRSLPVDHDHKLLRLKVRTKKTDAGWWAWISELPTNFLNPTLAATKTDAIRGVRDYAKNQSARGVICFGCNTGIRKFRDNASYLRKAAEYLEKYQEKLCQNK